LATECIVPSASRDCGCTCRDSSMQLIAFDSSPSNRFSFWEGLHYRPGRGASGAGAFSPAPCATGDWGRLYLTGHLRCCATPSSSFGPRGLSHGCPRKWELPCGRPPASCVAVPAPHPWRTEGEGLDWRSSARRSRSLLLDSGVGGAGVDEGQARVNRSVVVIAPCPRRHPQPDAVLLKSHRPSPGARQSRFDSLWLLPF
jgi:hypothetical protein